MRKGGIDERAVAKPRGQAHQPGGGLLAAAVELQNLLIIMDRQLRRVGLDGVRQLLQCVEVALLEMRAARLDPQRRAEWRGQQEIAAVQRHRALHRLAINRRIERLLEYTDVILDRLPGRSNRAMPIARRY